VASRTTVTEVFKAAVGIERAGLLRATKLVCVDCENCASVYRDRKLRGLWLHEEYSNCAASRIYSLLSDDPILGDGRNER
jgi:hypothetical protein